jgi:glycogen debranching enzyme
VTLVEETSFCLASRNGDIAPGTPQGLFFLDTRFLSMLRLRVGGRPLESLAVAVDEPFAATFLGRPSPEPGREDSDLLVFRRRFVGRGLLEKVEVRNQATSTTRVQIELDAYADLADLFAVKEGRARAHGPRHAEYNPTRLVYTAALNGTERSATIDVDRAAEVTPSGFLWHAELEAGESWDLCVQVTGWLGDLVVEPRFTCAEAPTMSHVARRLRDWHETLPHVATDHAPFALATRRSGEDLGVLRLVDPAYPDDTVVAAGAPWFMTLFGRDSILTSYMALIVDPSLAKGVLRTLARLQGSIEDTETEEQPGRILHEVRFHDRPSWSLSEGTRYYGTVDATPLFVMLLGELRRWGLEREVVDELLPHADRALDWITNYGDADGDGYVEYKRLTPRGLENQGWKDSWDGIRFADGRFPEAPIALAEVQGYVYAAYLARAFFFKEAGDLAKWDEWRARAAALRTAFNRDFWIEDDRGGYIALGLDADKKPIDSVTSNMGHCLWTGILDPDHAAAVADRLVAPELFSGWGIRTLASDMAAYNPVSYHRGSVWPHDTALAVAGLVRYGHIEQAHRVIEGLLGVSDANEGRLPELLAGVSRDELSNPAIYPTSCIPQAWSAASPLLIMRSLLGFDPWIPEGKIWVSPALPEWMTRLRVANIPVSDHRVTISVENGHTEVEGLPPELTRYDRPRPPVTSAIDAV